MSCKFFDSFKNILLSYSLYIFSKDSHKAKVLLYFSESKQEKKIWEKVFLISFTNSFKDEYKLFFKFFSIKLNCGYSFYLFFFWIFFPNFFVL